MRSGFTHIALVLFIISTSVLIISGCDENDSDDPTSLINGDVDLKQKYYKAKFKNPALIEGKITNKSTKAMVGGVTITARLENTTTKYSTTSKSDGSYELYVEGSSTYIIYAEKEGFDKSYYFQSYYGAKDTTFLINSGNNAYSKYDISLAVHDPNIFKVNYLAIKSPGKYMIDIGFNGTYLVSCSYNSAFVNQYDSEGNYMKNSPFKQYMEFLGCQDTIYWTGTSSFKTLYKVGQKSGKTIATITCETTSSAYMDVEVYDNKIWLINSEEFYKLSLAGELLSVIDLSSSISNLDMVGITHKDNYIYLLNREIDNSTAELRHVMYKFNPATGKVLSKGYLPDNLNDLDLLGLAYDLKSFWTIKVSASSYDDLIKLSITE